jgi:hypothetical protein
VLVVAGVRDHTTDYRSAIALAYVYRHGRVFLADDDHMLHRMHASGTDVLIMRTFLAHGWDSPQFEKVLQNTDSVRFRGGH